jgi:hypothetical protein
MSGEQVVQISKSSNSSNLGIPLYGDIEQLGWAVYKSLDLGCQIPSRKAVRDDIVTLLYHSQIKSYWKAIHGTLTNGRLQLKLSAELGLVTQHSPKYKNLMQYLEEVESKVLRRIEGFENATVNYKSLLANKGVVPEQPVHSDFGIPSS